MYSRPYYTYITNTLYCPLHKKNFSCQPVKPMKIKKKLENQRCNIESRQDKRRVQKFLNKTELLYYAYYEKFFHKSVFLQMLIKSLN